MTDEIPQEWIDVAVDAFNRDQRSGASTVGGMVYAALAAVFPLIEQRVIDRLAREAGEPPDEIPYVPGEVRGDTIWKRGVACGVAAERARWEDARSLLEAIARASDPGSENASDEAWRFAYENASESAAQVLAALAPERTTGEDDARLRAAFDEVCDELDREGT